MNRQKVTELKTYLAANIDVHRADGRDAAADHVQGLLDTVTALETDSRRLDETVAAILGGDDDLEDMVSMWGYEAPDESEEPW